MDADNSVEKKGIFALLTEKLFPKPKFDVYEQHHTGLMVIHDTIRSAATQILKHAPEVKEPKDVEDLMGFSFAFLETLEHHHKHEEKVWFPVLATKLPMEQFPGDHEKMHPLLTDVRTLVKEYVEKPASYDATKLVTAMQALQDFMGPHLEAEEAVMTVDNFRSNFTKQEITRVERAIVKEAMKGNATVELTLIWHSSDTEMRKLFFYEMGNFPWFVSHLLVPYVFLPKHKTWWRYAMYQ